MRALILIAGALVLAGCSNNDQHDNTLNVDENLTAENIVSNDVTAIDAVTGDAANMAAEAEINSVDDLNATGLNAGMPVQPTAKSTTNKPAKPSSAPAKPKSKPAETAATTNTAD